MPETIRVAGPANSTTDITTIESGDTQFLLDYTFAGIGQDQYWIAPGIRSGFLGRSISVPSVDSETEMKEVNISPGLLSVIVVEAIGLAAVILYILIR